LAVVFLSESAVQLPGDANGSLPLLGVERLVDRNHGVVRASGSFVGAGRHAVTEKAFIPPAGGNELLGGSVGIVPEAKFLSHVLHVLELGLAGEADLIAAREVRAGGSPEPEAVRHLSLKSEHAQGEGLGKLTDIFSDRFAAA